MPSSILSAATSAVVGNVVGDMFGNNDAPSAPGPNYGATVANGGRALISLGQLKDLKEQQQKLSSQEDKQFDFMTALQDTLAKKATTANSYSPIPAISDSIKSILANQGSGEARYDATRQQLADSIASLPNLAGRYVSMDAADKERVLSALAALTSQTGALRSSMGAAPVVSQASINQTAAGIQAAKNAAIDRALQRTASAGMSDAIRRGMDSSTFYDDAQADIVSRFAPLYMEAEQQAADQAIQRAGATTQAIDNSRQYALSELSSILSPSLATAASLYKPRDADLAAASGQLKALGDLLGNDGKISNSGYENLYRLGSLAEQANQANDSNLYRFSTSIYDILSKNSALARRLYGEGATASGSAFDRLLTDPGFQQILKGITKGVFGGGGATNVDIGAVGNQIGDLVTSGQITEQQGIDAMRAYNDAASGGTWGSNQGVYDDWGSAPAENAYMPVSDQEFQSFRGDWGFPAATGISF